jgi:hypothetical protein
MKFKTSHKTLLCLMYKNRREKKTKAPRRNFNYFFFSIKFTKQKMSCSDKNLRNGIVILFSLAFITLISVFFIKSFWQVNNPNKHRMDSFNINH